MITDETLTRDYLKNFIVDELQKSKFLNNLDFEKDSIDTIMQGIKDLYMHVVELSQILCNSFEEFASGSDLKEDILQENLIHELSIESSILDRLLGYRPIYNIFKNYFITKQEANSLNH